MAKSKHRRFSEIARLQYSQQISESDKQRRRDSECQHGIYSKGYMPGDLQQKTDSWLFFLSLELAKS